MASIEVRDVTVALPHAPPSLDDVTLFVGDGELVVVTGPSGSGKTTLLRVIAGFQRPTAGSVWLDHREVTDLDPTRRNLAMVFEEYALYPQRTAEWNISFPLQARRVKPEAERARRVRREARHLSIEHLLGKKPSELSAGHQQAVATARSLVRTSAALLMDEPLANLDVRLRSGGRIEIKRIHRELGATLLYVTNDQTEAMALADRLVVLDRGRVQQVGPPRRVYLAPANVMVAGFLGSPPMNLVPAEVVSGEAGTELLMGTDRLQLDARAMGRFPDLRGWLGVPLTVGIRAEHLRPSEGGDPFGRTIHGKVAAVEDLGAEATVCVDLGVRGASVLVRAHPPVRFRPGDPIEVTVSLEQLALFDPASGSAL